MTMLMRALFAALLLAFTAANPAQADDFPVTIAHKFGTSTIPQQPQQVVSLGFSGVDDILALGVKPVAVRYWYGDYPYGVWPWAQAVLGDAQPALLKGDINIEQIAALQPDLILAIGSGITDAQYAILSQIAPTIGPQAEYGDYGTPWQAEVRSTALALGKSAEAEVQIKAIEDRFAAIRAAHPDWQGKTAALGYFYNGAPGAYRSPDPRARLLNALGFQTPQAIDQLGNPTDFFATLSSEDLSPLDADLVIWFDVFGSTETLTLRSSLRAYAEGREIFLPENVLAGAFSYSSLLSINYALDELVPLIELAVDGNPDTVVPNGEGVLAPNR